MSIDEMNHKVCLAIYYFVISRKTDQCREIVVQGMVEKVHGMKEQRQQLLPVWSAACIAEAPAKYVLDILEKPMMLDGKTIDTHVGSNLKCLRIRGGALWPSKLC
ncbi:hypothetical protein MTR_2g060530 [Medicago truncatula]|uniref:Uncharacterized protein n=1 Tax=Medicago truncatula TaxID=3880 RepID=G7IGT0_MEDTR|nr:hypothetical protein MTR_2g060530 [Medicago truncatula]